MRILVLASLLWWSLGSYAVESDEIVEVGFLELRQWNGSLRLLEPDFRFGHVAVKVNNKWLHAHPVRGVEWVERHELEKLGRIALTVSVALPTRLTWSELSSWIGRPYDTDFTWEDDRMYCSELVAKVLGIPAEPMHFDPALWPANYLALEGRPGISPGGVFRALANPARLCAEEIFARTTGQ